MSLFLIVGCAEDSEIDTMEAERNLQIGWEKYNAGNYTEAILSFERSINLDESLADAYNGLGWARLSVSQNPIFNKSLIEEAKLSFSNAVKIDDKNADAWVGLANTLFLRRNSKSDFEKAIEALDIAMKEADAKFLYRHDYQSEAVLYALKSVCYFYINNEESAGIEANTTLKIQPENQTALSIQKLIDSE